MKFPIYAMFECHICGGFANKFKGKVYAGCPKCNSKYCLLRVSDYNNKLFNYLLESKKI